MACAVSGATAMVGGVCSGQTALDRATDPTYAGGWSAGQNGGFGFGAWSFGGTDPTPAGVYQAITTGSSLGTAWTLMTHSNSAGLANAGRAILGGLQVGQTFETLIQNPNTYHFYRGWDISFMNATANNPGGVNTAQVFLNVFGDNPGIYNGVLPNWHVTDGSGGATTTLSPYDSAAKGVKIDLTATSATTYSLTLTSQNGALVYIRSGTLTAPIDWVDFRLYNGASSGLTDTANNFEISYVEIIPEPSTVALIGLGFGGLLFLRRRE